MPAAFTLTPEVLTAIAKLPLSQTKTGNWLDDTLNTAELATQVTEILNQHFGSNYYNFFVAVAMFLQQNDFLPDVSVPESEEESFDAIDMMDERNW